MEADMRSAIGTFGVTCVVSFLIAAQISEAPGQASPGCCKQRADEKSVWADNGLDYNRCAELNKALDRDNVFDEHGKIWWDLSCVR
jgi:hypothetical protein